MDDELLIFLLSVLSAAVALVINWLIAKEFYKVAQMKGYNDKKYMWLSFLLGAVGYLLVIALPVRSSPATVANDELPEL